MEIQKPIYKVTVPKYHYLQNDPKVIIYNVNVATQTKSWSLEKRYSQFDQLSDELKILFNTLIPELPKKTFMSIFKAKSHDEIDERRIGLEIFMNTICSRQDMLNSEPLIRFLDLEQNAYELTVNTPQCMYQFQQMQYGIRDFQLQEDDGLLFVVVSDMNIITRGKTYLSNIKLPWEEQKGEQENAMGYLQCLLQCQMNDNYVQLWSRQYVSQIGCLKWDRLAEKLLVGLDQGGINVLEIKNSKKNQYGVVESRFLQLHEQRIMGLAFDSQRGLIHSISKDRKYCVYDEGTNGQIISIIEPSPFGLSALVYEQQRKKSFIGDLGGSIFIFDTEDHKPNLLIQLPSQLKRIRGLYLDSVEGQLFTVGLDEGHIIIYDVQKQGQEKYTKILQQLKHRENSREIQFSRKRGEIYIGNTDGTIAIMNLKQSETIYVIKAHNDAITKLLWLESDGLLISGSKDRLIRVWRLPENWRKEPKSDNFQKLDLN